MAVQMMILNLAKTISSFRSFTENKQGFHSLLLNYGWYTSLEDADFEKSPITLKIKNDFSGLEAILEKYSGNINFEDINQEEVKELISLCQSISRTISDLRLSIDINLPVPLNQKDFWEDIASQLLTNVLVEYFRRHLPFAYSMLFLSGIISYEDQTLKTRSAFHIFEPALIGISLSTSFRAPSLR